MENGTKPKLCLVASVLQNIEDTQVKHQMYLDELEKRIQDLFNASIHQTDTIHQLQTQLAAQQEIIDELTSSLADAPVRTQLSCLEWIREVVNRKSS